MGKCLFHSIKPYKNPTKKAISTISSESWNKHTPPLFHQQRILILDDIIKLNTSIFMYDIYHKNLSEMFLNMFTPLSSIHQHNTRKSKSQHFFINYTRTDYKKRFINTSGIKIWDQISINTKTKKRHIFKKEITSDFISNYKYM